MPNESQVFHSAFGLCLRSNRPVPGLVRSAEKRADVEICLGVEPPGARGSVAEELHYVSSITDESGAPSFRIWRIPEHGLLRMEYLDGVCFWFDRGGTKVWGTWPQRLTIADATVYLAGPILGVVLRLRGVTCLHASAAALGDHAIVFAGPEGAGKSTTAAALGRRGHAILSDDIVALDERNGKFLVFPAHPYLCLWSEAVEMLYGREKTLPEFSPSWDKRRLAFSEQNLRFQEEPLPLGAVCLLGEPSLDAKAPYAEAISTRDSLMWLVANSYGTKLLEQEMRAREFETLARLVERVPVRRLRPSRDKSKIEALCDLIEEQWGDSIARLPRQ